MRDNRRPGLGRKDFPNPVSDLWVGCSLLGECVGGRYIRSVRRDMPTICKFIPQFEQATRELRDRRSYYESNTAAKEVTDVASVDLVHGNPRLNNLRQSFKATWKKLFRTAEKTVTT
jgi:hypothetical protein